VASPNRNNWEQIATDCPSYRQRGLAFLYLKTS
jgi:hypothetical protein